MPTTIFI